MEANELMLGDWVKFPGGAIDKIVDLPYIEGKGICASFAASATLFPFSIEKIEPIPLTTEILEKNGFKKDDETDQWYFKSEDRLDMGLLAVGIDDGCGVGLCVMSNGAITYYCKYVHELQHFLRLIGGAKEIEL